VADLGSGLSIVKLRHDLEELAVADEVPRMAAYMKDKFAFLGVKSKPARKAAKPLLAASAKATGNELVAFADRCWAQPEREFQYVATLVLRRRVANLSSLHLADIEKLITTKAWWDTVDSLAVWTVGPLVGADAKLADTMDRWVESEDMWLARTAILHQLSYKENTDQARLFTYAEQRAADNEFFIRKAIGWALRQYARTEPEAVRSFVLANEQSFSGLTVRAAIKRTGREPA